MNPQPDQLFRDKLQNHHMPAPPSAWERIEKNLGRSRPFNYWRAAAAVVLLIAAAVLIYSLRTTPPQPAKPLTESISEPQQKPVLPEQALTDNPLQYVQTSTHQATALKKNRRPDEHAAKVMGEMYPVPDVPDTESTTIALAEQDKPKGSTTIITLAEAQQFLKSEISVADATSDNKKSSRFQKLVELASVLASEEDVLGQLRGRKDELFVRSVRTVRNEQNN